MQTPALPQIPESESLEVGPSSLPRSEAPERSRRGFEALVSLSYSIVRGPLIFPSLWFQYHLQKT